MPFAARQPSGVQPNPALSVGSQSAQRADRVYPRQTAFVVPVPEQPLKNDPDHAGRGKTVDDPKIRRQVFDLSPEVEQRHDPAMAGAAMIVDVARIQGTSPKGPVSVVIN